MRKIMAAHYPPSDFESPAVMFPITPAAKAEEARFAEKNYSPNEIQELNLTREAELHWFLQDPLPEIKKLKIVSPGTFRFPNEDVEHDGFNHKIEAAFHYYNILVDAALEKILNMKQLEVLELCFNEDEITTRVQINILKKLKDFKKLQSLKINFSTNWHNRLNIDYIFRVMNSLNPQENEQPIRISLFFDGQYNHGFSLLNDLDKIRLFKIIFRLPHLISLQIINCEHDHSVFSYDEDFSQLLTIINLQGLQELDLDKLLTPLQLSILCHKLLRAKSLVKLTLPYIFVRLDSAILDNFAPVLKRLEEFSLNNFCYDLGINLINLSKILLGSKLKKLALPILYETFNDDLKSLIDAICSLRDLQHLTIRKCNDYIISFFALYAEHLSETLQILDLRLDSGRNMISLAPLGDLLPKMKNLRELHIDFGQPMHDHFEPVSAERILVDISRFAAKLSSPAYDELRGHQLTTVYLHNYKGKNLTSVANVTSFARLFARIAFDHEYIEFKVIVDNDPFSRHLEDQFDWFFQSFLKQYRDAKQVAEAQDKAMDSRLLYSCC